MKGLTKTLVALVLVMTLIATMGMSAMAASYSTKTTYKANDEIEVVANATDLPDGAIVTYVATSDENVVNEGTIVYLNQKEEVDGKASFTYTTSVTNIDASMFFGGSEETERKPATVEGGFNVTVKIGESTKVVSVLEQESASTVVVRKFDLSDFADLSGTNITSVKFNGVAISNDCVYADATTLMVSTNLINEEGTLEITTAAAPDFVAPRISATTEVVDGNLVAVAKAPAGEDFGIVVYKGEEPAEFAHEYSNADGVIVLPALGKNVAGVYAVEVEAIAEFAGNEFNVAAYAFNGTKPVLSNVKAIEVE